MMKIVALATVLGAATAIPSTAEMNGLVVEDSQCLGEAGSYGHDKQCLPSWKPTCERGPPLTFSSLLAIGESGDMALCGPNIELQSVCTAPPIV